MRVLCIAAHPDDEILGVGGTLLRHKNKGDEVSVALCYPCRVGDDEIKEASSHMGIPYHYYVDYVQKLVDEVHPDIVYTHSGADLHSDHRDLLQRVMVACRPLSGVRGLYCFETPSATDWGPRPFIPQKFVDITATVDGKVYAMEAYESELRDYPHPRNIDSLDTRAGYWGQRVGVDYAEAFEVVRECW